MKVQVDWLKEYVEIDKPAAELGHMLTMAGLEIESHELLDEEKGDVLELNVTPNRGYCLSHLGVAREVSVLMGVFIVYMFRTCAHKTVWGIIYFKIF